MHTCVYVPVCVWIQSSVDQGNESDTVRMFSFTRYYILEQGDVKEEEEWNISHFIDLKQRHFMGLWRSQLKQPALSKETTAALICNIDLTIW